MNSNQTEQWKPILESEFYEVSNLGRIRLVTTREIKKPTIGANGAALVNIKLRSSWSVRCVSGLVAGAFLGPRPRGHMVAHKDHDRTNTALSNLHYVPLGWRTADNPTERGRYLVGKLDSSQAREIRKRARDGECGRRLAEEFGVSAPLVSQIKSGSKWAGTKRTRKS